MSTITAPHLTQPTARGDILDSFLVVVFHLHCHFAPLNTLLFRCAPATLSYPVSTCTLNVLLQISVCCLCCFCNVETLSRRSATQLPRAIATFCVALPEISCSDAYVFIPLFICLLHSNISLLNCLYRCTGCLVVTRLVALPLVVVNIMAIVIIIIIILGGWYLFLEPNNHQHRIVLLFPPPSLLANIRAEAVEPPPTPALQLWHWRPETAGDLLTDCAVCSALLCFVILGTRT